MTERHRGNSARFVHESVPVVMPRRFGFVAGGDRAGRARQRLHDDDGLAAQGRIALLLARRKEGIEPASSIRRCQLINLQVQSEGTAR